MFDAARFIERTLHSVRNQTFSNIEIIVVDDGSSDAGPQIVQRHAAEDPRIRLVRQENAGVAEARNRGAAEAVADRLAFIDADDLWTPAKLARQIARMDASPEVGLVYSWYTRIDADDATFAYDSSSIEEGDCLAAVCSRNFIGNGSSVLVRRELFERSGGFDAALRGAGAEGCEDYYLYALLAAVTKFALVREFDVAYRVTPDNMSSNLAAMARSRMICSRRLIARFPQHKAVIRHGRRRFMRWSSRRALREGRWADAGAILWQMLSNEPFAHLVDLPAIVLRAAIGSRIKQGGADSREGRLDTGAGSDMQRALGGDG